MLIRFATQGHALCKCSLHNRPHSTEKRRTKRRDERLERLYYRTVTSESKDQTVVSSSESRITQPAQNPLYKDKTFCQSQRYANTSVR